MKVLKRFFAGVLSAAMAVTLMPEALVHTQAAEAGNVPILQYDMNYDGSKLLDASGNGHDAEMVGFSDGDFADGEITFDGTDNYVKIPSSVKDALTDEQFTIMATFKNNVKSAAWLFTLGTTVSTWPNVYNYLFVSPNSSDSAYSGSILGAIKDETAEHRCPTDILLTPDTARYNTVAVVVDNGNVTYYLNGKANTVTESDVSIADMLAANSTADCIGYIGKSLYQPDPYFTGTLSDFKIYDDALSAEVVKSSTLKAYIDNNPDVEFGLDAIMLGENTSIDVVTKDLYFPSEIDGIDLKWESSDTSVIDQTGKVTVSDDVKQVTIKVTGSLDGEPVLTETFSVKVMSELTADYSMLAIYNRDNIKGNITLPSVGKYGSTITWESSNEAVISTKEKVNEGYDNTPAGVVTRQAKDTAVTLKATIRNGYKSRVKTFRVTVKAKAEEKELTDYVFAYFIGNNPGEEEIFFASSENGLDWSELNGGKSVIASDMGTKGLRDPYIMRSAEGDKFYMIATDLRICTDWNWGAAQRSGSQAIMVWESDDMVTWSKQRMVTISADIEAGCTWAPEIFYDEKTGEYLVFWASKVKTDDYAKQRLYYCKTRDFYTFTEPKVWIDNSHSTIDSTVVYDETDGKYYRFSKNESQTFVYLESADTLLGEWSTVNAKIAGGVEGPCCFKVNDDDVESFGAEWCLLLDDFGGIGYYPMITSSLAGGSFTKTSANLPAKPRHGTVMGITTEEYQALTAQDGIIIEETNAEEAAVADSDPETGKIIVDETPAPNPDPDKDKEQNQDTNKDQNQNQNQDQNQNQNQNQDQNQSQETTITLNTVKVVMGLNEKDVKLTATVNNAAVAQPITWTSDKTNVVTVKDGKLTASKKKTGTAKITATTADGKTATCTVIVKNAPKKISVKAKKTKLKKGQTTQITVKKYTPSNAASYKLTYKSSNKKVATVSETGKVTAKKKGTAKITVTTYNKKKATIKITVK